MKAWNVLHAARWKYRMQKFAKNLPYGHHRTILSGYIFTTKAYIDSGKNFAKQQYLLHMLSQYGEFWPTDGWDQLASLGHHIRFQRVCVLASLYRRRSTEVNQTLRDAWLSSGLVHYIYTFGSSCPLTEFCQVQNSLGIQVLRSPILAALLHGTQLDSSSGRHPNFAAWDKEGNYGTFAPRPVITLGIGP